MYKGGAPAVPDRPYVAFRVVVGELVHDFYRNGSLVVLKSYPNFTAATGTFTVAKMGTWCWQPSFVFGEGTVIIYWGDNATQRLWEVVDDAYRDYVRREVEGA